MNLKQLFFGSTKPEIINPYLAAFVPLVFIYAHNIEQTYMYSALRISIVIFLVVTALRLLINAAIRDQIKTSLILTLSLLVSFVSGHLTRLLPYFELIRIGDVALSRNPFMFLISILLICIIIYKIYISKLRHKTLSRFIASTGVIVLLVNTIYSSWSLYSIGNKNIEAPLSNTLLTIPHMKKLPDIYYIILDGHARSDVLQNLYQYESPLGDALKQNGFYVASRSQSNYVYTLLSLATSLNYNYIENLSTNFKIGEKNPTILSQLIENNKAARRLKMLGYSYTLLGSGYFATEKSHLADTVYEYVYDLNNLELAYIRTNIFARLLSYVYLDPRTFHKNRILFEFETLKRIPKDIRPTFTFAHILSPHPPFVFNEYGKQVGQGGRHTLTDGYGSVRTKEEYKNGYLQQLKYIDELLLESLEEILKTSEVPPIIIVQSDHGPASEINWENNQKNIFLSDVIDNTNPNSVFERTGILNAYYFPYGGETKLYDSITPVNSFRLLFDYYFGGDFPLLEDQTHTNM